MVEKEIEDGGGGSQVATRTTAAFCMDPRPRRREINVEMEGEYYYYLDGRRQEVRVPWFNVSKERISVEKVPSLRR